MGIFSKTVGTAVLVGAAVGGNWLGDQLRGQRTSGQRQWVQQISVPTGDTSTVIDVQPLHVALGLITAVLAGKPRSFWAFAGSALAAALISDTLEGQIIERLQNVR